jgi:hypothetical protein
LIDKLRVCQKERHREGKLFGAVCTMGDVQRGRRRCKFLRGENYEVRFVSSSPQKAEPWL